MQTSQRGIELIKAFEGLRLHAYLDGGGVPTIGYGHTSDVELGDTVTPEGAERMLVEDLHDVEDVIDQLVSVPLNQNQYDALACFIYNIGYGQFETSTLRRKLNAHNYSGAKAEFKRWKYDNGEVVDGLIRRRAAEAQLFGAKPNDPHWYDAAAKKPRDP